ncbi:hypothetical protein K7X08_034901 [Anisodus acutangulus]|uniref:Histone deacetylase n=1 Tax=Anisodus acutangulus TaxID=402998 RepID=A0A9Q1LHT0_9SOLA|nr:hypothetical protein K7X08_034901 [Anisodus acutangulus]
MDSSTVEGGASLLSTGTDATKRLVSYFFDPYIGDYYYGQGHPMKPHRIHIAHNLVCHYYLHKKMDITRPLSSSAEDIGWFHSPDYVDFSLPFCPRLFMTKLMMHATLNGSTSGRNALFLMGFFIFVKLLPVAAVKLIQQDADIAINWAGGLHDAKKSAASGFCYVNDIVLGILELLKVHNRVLYIDIDVHHGDGVEEAFYTTDRVMTVSFHKFGDFFPGAGHIEDIGIGTGKYYALNAPLNDGIYDESFRSLFRPVIQKMMEVYQPDALVLQCGADSLAGDRLGCFNCQSMAMQIAFDTIAVGIEPENKLPDSEYYENMLLEQLSHLPHAPSVPFQMAPFITEVREDREEDMDRRPKPRIWMKEEYESDTDEEEKPKPRFSNTGITPTARTDMSYFNYKVKDEDMF